MRKLTGNQFQFEFVVDQVFPPKRVRKIKTTKNGLLFLCEGLMGEWLAHYEPYNQLAPEAAITKNWECLYIEADGKGSVLVLDDEETDSSYFKMTNGWFVLQKGHKPTND